MPSSYNVGGVEIALTTQLNDAISAVNKLANELNKISGVLGKTKTHIDNVGKSTTNVKNNADKASKALSGMFSLGKLYFFINYSKRIAQSIGGIVQSAIDYRETINKFEVSMGNMYDRAVAFQNKMSEAYGLSKADLMDYQANFNNIIKGLGNIDVEASYNMSETLTEMAVDFASLFNVGIDSAMTTFQSALTQQVRPVRKIAGFDITTPTLRSVMESIGITDRQISQLNQVEKRLLIIIALQRQMQNVGALGDFARTIEQPANQLKILSQQLKETGIVLGNFVLHYIAPAIKYVLGFVMAIKVLIQSLGALAGYEEDDSVSAPLLEFEDAADGAAGAVGKTKKAVEDLKKATTGIDELNIISQPKDTDTGGGVGGGLSGIDPRLTAELEKYNSVLGDVEMKAKKIRDHILDWLGVTDGTYENLNKIKTALELVALAVAGVGLAIGAIKFAGWISSIKNLTATGIFGKIGEVIALWAGGAGTLKESIETIFPGLLKILRFALGIFLIVAGIIRGIQGVNKLLDDDTSNDMQGVLEIIEAIGLAVAGVAVLFGAWPVAIIAGGVALTAWLIETFGPKIEKWANTWADDFVDAVYRAWGNIRSFGSMVLKNIGIFFNNMGVGIYNYFVTTFDNIVNVGIRALNRVINFINRIPFINIPTITELSHTLKDKKSYTNYATERGNYLQKHGYATGGFPSRGDYFLANENGVPEYVGSIGNRTAVANTNQIVQGISYGVSMAQSEQNALLRQQNSLLQQILSKGTDVYLDGRKVTNELGRVANARGTQVVLGGFGYGY